MCHHRRPTEANINKHMPSLQKKKKSRRGSHSPALQSASPNEVMGLVGWIWTNSRIFRDWALQLKPGNLTSDPPHPPLCESGPVWLAETFGLATGQFCFCVFWDNVHFFFVLSSVLSVPWFPFSPFSRSNSFCLTQLCAHTRQGSQILHCVFPKLSSGFLTFFLLSSKSAHQLWWLITELYWGQHPDMLATWAHG